MKEIVPNGPNLSPPICDMCECHWRIEGGGKGSLFPPLKLVKV